MSNSGRLRVVLAATGVLLLGACTSGPSGDGGTIDPAPNPSAAREDGSGERTRTEPVRTSDGGRPCDRTELALAAGAFVEQGSDNGQLATLTNTGGTACSLPVPTGVRTDQQPGSLEGGDRLGLEGGSLAPGERLWFHVSGVEDCDGPGGPGEVAVSLDRGREVLTAAVDLPQRACGRVRVEEVLRDSTGAPAVDSTSTRELVAPRTVEPRSRWSFGVRLTNTTDHPVEVFPCPRYFLVYPAGSLSSVFNCFGAGPVAAGESVVVRERGTPMRAGQRSVVELEGSGAPSPVRVTARP